MNVNIKKIIPITEYTEYIRQGRASVPEIPEKTVIPILPTALPKVSANPPINPALQNAFCLRREITLLIIDIAIDSRIKVLRKNQVEAIK